MRTTYADALRRSLLILASLSKVCDYMNSEAIPAKFDEIIKHRAKKNMGEIRSLALAHYLGISIFMPNDTGAKQLARSRIDSSP